jgi:hypothetical protein
MAEVNQDLDISLILISLHVNDTVGSSPLYRISYLR